MCVCHRVYMEAKGHLVEVSFLQWRKLGDQTQVVRLAYEVPLPTGPLFSDSLCLVLVLVLLGMEAVFHLC